MDASSFALGVLLAEPREGDIDHPISFASRKLSFAKKNHMDIEREGQAMVYVLHKFNNYLFGGNFNMFTDHSTLKYLFNNPMLEGKI